MSDQQPRQAFSHIGGHVVIDLVNTVGWRLAPQRRTERLQTFADVVAWCTEAGLTTKLEADKLSSQERRRPRAANDEWQAVLRLRDHLYDVLIAADKASAKLITDEYKDAIDHAELIGSEDGSWRWVDSKLTLATPRHRIARSTVELLSGPDVGRVHQCQDDACGWVFVDTSPRQNRRWCVSADCGNRNRARLHYQRRTRA